MRKEDFKLKLRLGSDWIYDGNYKPNESFGKHREGETMKLAMHNLLMRLGSPAAHAILLGLAIAFMSITSKADTLLVIDRLDCPSCIKFKAEVSAEDYAANEAGAKAPMVIVSFLDGKLQEEPPEWFIPALRDGRINQLQYTPTFILLNDNHREVSRFIGYRDRDWFFGKLEEHVRLWEQKKSIFDVLDSLRTDDVPFGPNPPEQQ